MWTSENRKRYERGKLRYPSNLTDEEWALIAPLTLPARRGGNKRTVDLRAIVEQTIGWLNRCRRLAKDWECRTEWAGAHAEATRTGSTPADLSNRFIRTVLARTSC